MTSGDVLELQPAPWDQPDPHVLMIRSLASQVTAERLTHDQAVAELRRQLNSQLNSQLSPQLVPAPRAGAEA